MDWFYDSNGQQVGPVPREEMLRLIMQRRIGPDTLVWTSSFGDAWRPASASGLVSPLTGLVRTSSDCPEHWAWVLLLAPWIIQHLTLLVLHLRHVPQTQSFAQIPVGVGMMSLILFFVAFMFDRNAIRDAGRRPPGFWWWLFLPGYFWRRRQILGRGTSLLIVSLVLLAVNVVDTVRRLPQIEQQIHARQSQMTNGDDGSTGPSSHDGSSEQDQEEEL